MVQLGALMGHWDEARALLHDDLLSDDRRSMVGDSPVEGVDSAVAANNAAAEVGLTRATGSTLAVRGDRLSLHRALHHTDGDFDVEFLLVAEIDDAGRVTALVYFDPDALADAIDELDARYLAGEGAPSAWLLRNNCRSFAAANARDWDAYRDTYTPGFVCADRRQIGWPTLDRDGIVATIREYTELAPDLFLLLRKVEIRGSACLSTIDAFGTTPDGIVVEWVQHTVSAAEPTGIWRSLELFDEDDFAAALARLDELGTTEPTETRTPVAENDAATVLARAWELTVAGRFDEIGRLCAEDAVVFDGQRIIGEDLVGRDAIVANCRAVAALGAEAARVEPLAVRGSKLALCRTIVSFGSFENVFLSVAELDSQGLGQHIVTFDEDGLVEALDELDARYGAGEGAQDGVAFSDFPIVNLVNRRDWSAILDPDFPEFTQVDHRQLGWPTVDRQGWVATMQQYVELVPDLVMVVRKIHQRGGAGLTTLDPVGTTADGSAVAWATHTVFSVDPDGRIRLETFDLDDFAAALARLDELGAEPAEVPGVRLENTATRIAEQLGVLINENRFDDVAALLAPDMVNDDRRSTVSFGKIGRDDLLDGLRSSRDVGFTLEAGEVVAVRGDRLSLARMVWRTEADDEIAQLTLCEVGPDGRCTALVTVDDDRLDDAIAELDDRYLAGEGGNNPAVRLALETVSLSNRQDWDGLWALYHSDFTFVDGRQIGFPTLDRDELTAMLRDYEEVVPDWFQLVRSIQVRGPAVLFAIDSSGATADGLQYERAYYVVFVADSAGRIIKTEAFAEDDFAAAIARLDELGATPPTDPRDPRAANATTRTVDRFFDLARADRVEEAAAQLTPDVVRVDHRTAVADATTHGRDEYMTALRGAFDIGFAEVRIDHLAVRGERLALFRSSFTTESEMQLVMLSVGETNAHGLVTHISLYDEDALNAAVAELDARYLTGEGAGDAAVLQPSMDHVAAFNLRDWDALLTTLRPDIVIGDHRGLWPPTSDRDAYLARMQSLAETTPDSIVLGRKFLVAGNASLATYEVQGTSEHGDHYEYVFHIPGTVAGGKFVGFEFFADDQWPAALARLDELSRGPVAPTIENSVTRLNAVWVEAKNAGRSAELEHLIAPGYTVVSHRFGGIVPATEGIEQMRVLSSAGDDVGFTAQTMEPIAVRRDRLALTRIAATTTDGLISERLEVSEIDVEGRFARTEIFEADALADALVTLDRWYAAGEGADHSGVINVLASGYAAMNRRDFDAWATIHTPDHTNHDHSLIGFGELGTQTYREYLEAALEQAPDFVFVPATLDIDGHVALVTIPGRAATPAGFEFEHDLVIVTRFNDDLRISEDHFFSGDQWAEARAMFESLATANEPPAPQIRNTVTDALDRYAARLAAGDISMEGISADDILLFDRRRGISAPTFRGRAAVEANISAILEMFDRVAMEHLAIRGDHVALIHLQWTHEGFTLPVLAVYESDGDGLVIRATTFDDEDLDLALALDELEERFIAGEGAEHEFAILRAGDVRRGAGAADRAAAYKALHTPDCRVTDHRLLSWPTETVSDVVDQIRADRGISAPRTTVFATLEVLGDAVLITQDDHFVTPEGSEYLKRSLVITHSIAGLADSLDYFDPEQHEAARARFAELGNETRTPYIDNAVIRLLARGTWLEKYDPAHDHAADFAVDISFEDRRSGVSLPQMDGVDPVVANIAALNEVLGPTDFEPVAVRGDHLALVSTRTTSESGFEFTSLMIFETDDADRICHMVSFDEHAVADALEELDERYRAGLGGAPTDVEAALLDGVGRLNRRDWDRFAALLHPDLEAVDHSPLGFPPTDRDGFVNDQMRGMAELVPDFVVVLRKILTEGRATLAVGTTCGTTADGNAYAWEFIQVMRAAADGRALNRDLYADTQWTEALARFDQWSAAPPRDNTAVQTWAGIIAARAGSDPSAAIDLVAPDVFGIDRRAGVSVHDLVGRDAVAANAAAIEELFGVASRTFNVVAVRGDRLALLRAQITNADGFGISGLMVVEVNDAGEMIRCVYFDETAMEGALEELDSRFTHIEADEPVLENRATLAGRRAMDALTRGDRTAAIDVFAPDFTRSDRRRGPNIGEAVGREEYVDATLAGADVGMAHFEMTPIEIAGDDHSLTATRWHNGDGFELEWLLVTEVDADGRILRVTNFDVEDRAAASALLHEWTAEPQLSERISESSEVRMDALARGDREAVLATYTPDFVRDDRRRGINFGTSNREETVDALLAGNDVGLGNRDFTTVETIGENFALAEFRMSHDDGFELVYLLAIEQDDEGRLGRGTNFDLEDREQASALLHDWAAEREGHDEPPANTMTRTLEAFPALYAACDWDRFEYADPAMVVDDRRSAVSAGIVPGRDAVMDLVRGLYDVGFRTVTNVPVAVRGERLALFRRVWHNADGLDLPMLVLVEAAPPGLVDYQIMWDLEDLDSAMAELDRRFAEVETPSDPSFSNAATRAMEPYPEKFAARDWEWIAALIDEHAVSDDRRTAVSGGVVTGGDAILALTRGLEDVGFTTMSEQPIAIRGDRLVLTVRTWHDPHGFDLPLLACMEFGENGRMVANIMFDFEDLELATAELDRRYAAGTQGASAPSEGTA